MKVYFKDGVYIKFLTPALCYMLTRLEELTRLEGLKDYPANLFITSVADGVHTKNSQHYRGTAIDIRSKTFKTETAKLDFMHKYKLLLGSKFIILYESKGKANEHFHVQIKIGETYP